MRFSLATIVFDRESAQMSQILSSQGKNAPSNPYPHYLVRLATSRAFGAWMRACRMFSIREWLRYCRKVYWTNGPKWSKTYKPERHGQRSNQCKRLKVVLRGCKRSFGPKDQESPKSHLRLGKRGLRRCNPMLRQCNQPCAPLSARPFAPSPKHFGVPGGLVCNPKRPFFCQEWPRQTKPKKDRFMNFSQGHAGTKVRYVSRACFPKEKHLNSHKNGRNS